MGVAWEVGVLAALGDAGIDPAAAGVVVGSSAGSVVGTQIRQGRSLASLVAAQSEPAADGDALPTDLSPLIEIAAILRAAKDRTPAVLQDVGHKAMTAETPAENEWIGRFEQIVGGAWPEGDLRITTVDCNTGLRRVWTSADGVRLASAAAASCAIPAVFPAVSLDGSRFTDGGLWSSSNLDVVLDSEVDAAVFVGPLRSGDPFATSTLEQEIHLLESDGRRVEAIVPGPAFRDEIGARNLMNPALRGRGVELGMLDGADAADRVRALVS